MWSSDLRSMGKGWGAASIAVVMVGLLVGISLCGQNKPSYQTGTVIAVKPLPPAPGQNTAKQYELSVKVGSTMYLVLYTPAKANNVEYSVGTDRPVLIEGNTMKFSDLMGRTSEMKILSRKAAPSKQRK